MITSSVTAPALKSKGSDDPTGDDRGGKGGLSDDTSSSTSSSSSSSSSTDDSSTSASSSTSSSSSTDDSSTSASSSTSSSSSTDDSSTSTSSSASSSSSTDDSSTSASSSASSSSSTDDSSTSASSSTSSSFSTDDSSASASASASAATSSDDSGSGSDDATFLFDAAKYLEANPDLAGVIDLGAALSHYLHQGSLEDRAPNGWFDDDFYRASNSDLAGFDDATLFMHFNLYGVWEGRAPSSMFGRFDGQRYLDDNPDVAAYVNANLDDFLGSQSNGAIAHFLIYGAHESRAAFDDSGLQIDPGLFG